MRKRVSAARAALMMRLYGSCLSPRTEGAEHFGGSVPRSGRGTLAHPAAYL
jgi:hypothetical protein